MSVLFFKSQNCPKCPMALKNLETVIAELNFNVLLSIIDISTTEGRIEALNNMVSETPTVMINGNLYGPEVLMNKNRLNELLNEG